MIYVLTCVNFLCLNDLVYRYIFLLSCRYCLYTEYILFLKQIYSLNIILAILYFNKIICTLLTNLYVFLRPALCLIILNNVLSASEIIKFC